MTSKSLTFSRSSIIAATALALLSFGVGASSAYAQAVVTTDPATDITLTEATLNGTNGNADAANTSFWWGPSEAGPFTAEADPTAQVPEGWSYPPSGTGAQSANAAFSHALTGLTSSTTYHFVVWSNVDGIWNPGEVLNFTTDSDAPTAVADVYVNAESGDNENNCLTAETACETITAALALVDAGGTVHVAAGTYAEAVTVNKSVTLSGAQAGTEANSCEAGGSASVVGALTGAFVVQSNDVTIDGFTITGVSSEWGAGVHVAGEYDNVTVKNNLIRENVMGIYLNGSGSTVTHNCITNNNVAGSSSGNGIYSDQGLDDSTIANNTFTGAHANASVTFVSDASSGLTISDNEMESDGALYMVNVSGSTISGNTIAGSNSHGIQLDGGNDDVVISGNSITGINDGWSAIRVSRNNGNNGSIEITNNSLKDSISSTEFDSYGINSTDGEATVVANFNDLSNNDVALIYSDTGIVETDTLLDAQNNWWGCAAGPSSEAVSPCGLVEGNLGAIDFDPWLASLNLSGNDPVSAEIHNSDGSAVGGNTGLTVSFTSSGANPADPATTSIGGSNTAAYDINAVGSDSGDTTISGNVLFADESSTLSGTLVVNTPSSDGGGGGGGGGGSSIRRATPAVPATQLEGCVPGSGDLFDVTNGRSCTISAIPAIPGGGQVLGASTFKFLFNLSIGMRNNDVMELQKRFRSEGFFTFPTDTGYFGPITFAAAKAYQAAHPSIGYITGFVGPLTRGVLNQ